MFCPIKDVRVCERHSLEKTHYPSRAKWVCPKCETEAVTKRRQKVKRTLIEEAGGACTRCGYDRCIDALCFHHLDPATKERELSNWRYSLKRGREEVKKCVLVCANCHAEIHSELRLEG